MARYQESSPTNIFQAVKQLTKDIKAFTYKKIESNNIFFYKIVQIESTNGSCSCREQSSDKYLFII